MGRIKITKGKRNTGVLISFTTKSKRFDSNYERNKFFSSLYGRIQKVRHGDEVYRYKRDGLLDDVPHIKVDKSVFIVPGRQVDRVLGFFREWRPKVEYKSYRVILEPEQAEKLKPRKTRIEID